MDEQCQAWVTGSTLGGSGAHGTSQTKSWVEEGQGYGSFKRGVSAVS